MQNVPNIINDVGAGLYTIPHKTLTDLFLPHLVPSQVI